MELMLSTCKSREFAETFARVVAEQKASEREWVRRLRQIGIKAAHPNDGWHDREKGEFQLAYPAFDDGVQVGDQVALGDPSRFMVVTVTRVRRGLFGFGSPVYEYGMTPNG